MYTLRAAFGTVKDLMNEIDSNEILTKPTRVVTGDSEARLIKYWTQ
jgi:hypothetical protein